MALLQREAVRRVVAPASGRIDTTVRELVEWTYADQQAHRGSNVGACGYAGISQTGIVCDIMRLDCMIDKSPSGAQYYGVTHTDDDALEVHDRVECLFHKYRTALMQHGAARSMPDWRPVRVPLRAVPVDGRRGQPRGIYEGDGRRLIACELTYVGDVDARADYVRLRSAWPDAPTLRIYEDVVEFAREQYSIWYEALLALRNALAPLRRWRVVGVGAQPEPWIN